MSTRVLSHFIAGKAVVDAGTQQWTNMNPATGEVVSILPMDSIAAADQAVAAADEAYPAWSATPVGDRVQPLFKYKSILEANIDELADLIVAEHGKARAEAIGSVRRGIDCIEFACGAPTLMMGQTLPQIAVSSSFCRTEDEGGVPIDSTADRTPIGVCVGITPFNFPLMVPMWMWPMAVACGNTFVLKPSEKVPLSSVRAFEFADEAGFPPGVLNLVHGGADVVNHLITHDDVRAVSFVGSTKIAKHIYQTATAAGKRAQCMGGAKNYMVIMPDANHEAAIEGVIGSVFGNSGQRCLAGSAVVLVGDAGDWFVPAVVEATKKVSVASGETKGVGIGPVIDCASRERIAGYVQRGIDEGAEILLDGREALMPEGDCFIGPTIFDRVTSDMAIATDEIFGPVMSIMRASSLDEAIDTANTSPYGNMGVIFTSSGYSARRFKAASRAGMIGVNVGVPAPMSVFPFAGWGHSFYGDLHANGPDAVRFYTEYKITVTRWL